MKDLKLADVQTVWDGWSEDRRKAALEAAFRDHGRLSTSTSSAPTKAATLLLVETVFEAWLLQAGRNPQASYVLLASIGMAIWMVLPRIRQLWGMIPDEWDKLVAQSENQCLTLFEYRNRVNELNLMLRRQRLSLTASVVLLFAGVFLAI